MNSSTSQPSTNGERLRPIEYIGYALGATASNLFFKTFTIFVPIYYLDIWGIPATAWAWITVLVGLIGALLVRESWQRHPALRHLDTIALLGVLALQVGRVLFDANVLDVLVEFAAALQIIRLATRRGAAHDCDRFG